MFKIHAQMNGPIRLSDKEGMQHNKAVMDYTLRNSKASHIFLLGKAGAIPYFKHV